MTAAIERPAFSELREAALARYLAFQQTPKLTQAQKVEVASVAEDVQVSTFGKKFFDGLKSLRGRWMR